MIPVDSMAGRILLLSYDGENGRFTARDRMKYLVRAATLVDLALLGCVADSTAKPGLVVPTGGGQVSDPVLQNVLNDITASSPKSGKHWVRRDAGETLREVRIQLVAAGVIGVEKKHVLGVVPRRVTVLRAIEQAAELQRRAGEALSGGHPVEQIDPRDATAVVLAAHGKLRTVLSRRDEKQYDERIKALTERVGAAGPALSQLLETIRAAIIGAVAHAPAG